MTTYTPGTLSKPQMRQLCADVKRSLIGLYGTRLNQVWLYGSYARGDFHAESDIDFLVVLHDEVVKFGSEIRFMGDVIGELSHQYDLFISVKPVSSAKLSSSDSPFYQAVRREGKPL